MFLGTGFLLLDVFAMIWHAAVDRQQTWIWYVSGIVLGAAILALFALFEKRRNDLLAVAGAMLAVVMIAGLTQRGFRRFGTGAGTVQGLRRARSRKNGVDTHS